MEGQHIHHIGERMVWARRRVAEAHQVLGAQGVRQACGLRIACKAQHRDTQ